MPNVVFAVDYYPLYPAEEREVGNLDFTVHERCNGENHEGVKILILGGIQGDEPGAFSAASLLTTHYTFNNSQIFIIPNLNLPSIVTKQRGVTGDMNRKFAELAKDDPQYDEVMRLQNYILEVNPDIILNLHDGSGFYSEKYVSPTRGPQRWGQSCIIDQAEMDSNYGNLLVTAEKIINIANSKIDNSNYHFAVKNTHTNEGNPSMEKSLTWFGVRNNIASYGLEVSKEFNMPSRAYYHLLQVEAFFENYDVDFERNFSLTIEGVEKALGHNVYLTLADGKVFLPLQNIKNKQLGYIPLPKDSNCSSLQPILVPVKKKDSITVHYGNNTLTNFKTKEYNFLDLSPTFLVRLPFIEENEDGKETQAISLEKVGLGEIVKVPSSFYIEHQEGYRINAIGARKEVKQGDVKTEAGVKITKKDFDSRYALDKGNNIFRIEVYNEKDFVGMFLVDFSKDPFDYKILGNNKDF